MRMRNQIKREKAIGARFFPKFKLLISCHNNYYKQFEGKVCWMTPPFEALQTHLSVILVYQSEE